jgi:hypothetical protein
MKILKFNLLHLIFQFCSLPRIFNYSRHIRYIKSFIKQFYTRTEDPDLNEAPYPFTVYNIITKLYAMVSYKRIFRDIIDKNTFHESFLTEGFKFFVHNPYDVLTSDAKYTISKVYYSIQHHLTPTQTLIDDSLINYSPVM